MKVKMLDPDPDRMNAYLQPCFQIKGKVKYGTVGTFFVYLYRYPIVDLRIRIKAGSRKAEKVPLPTKKYI
jgi:hypothetical protein